MGPEEYVQTLERRNQLLLKLVADLSNLIKGLLEVMPPDVREDENVQRMLEISEKLVEYGTTVQTPRDS